MQHRELAAAGIASAFVTTLLVGAAAPAVSSASAGAAVAGSPSKCTPADLAFTVFPEYRKFRDSRKLRTPVVMHGKVTDTSGKPLRRAVVLLAATSADLTTMVPIAVNETNGMGEYVLRAAMTPKVRALYERYGLDLNMEWFVPGHRHLVWGTTVQWDADRRAWTGIKQDNAAHRGPGTRAATPRNREDIALDPAHAGRDVSGLCPTR